MIPTCTEPAAIYERARQSLLSERYPAYLGYTVDVSATSGGVTKEQHYASQLESPANIVHVQKTSAEEQAKPVIPHGINLMFKVQTPGLPSVGILLNPVASQDTFGVPLLSPTYMFGLTPVQRVDMTRADADAASLIPVIATVATADRSYDITCAGVEDLSGATVYHLMLHPIRHPMKYRLRELWVDTTSFVTLQARTAGNFTDTPLLDVPWLIRFKESGGNWYIDSETAEGPIQYSQRSVYTGVVISFQDLVPATRSTVEFLFDQLPIIDPLVEPNTAQ